MMVFFIIKLIYYIQQIIMPPVAFVISLPTGFTERKFYL